MVQTKKKKKIQSTGKKNQCQCFSGCKNRALEDSPFCFLHKDQCPRMSPLSRYEPDYDPDFWNSHYNIKETHNCFAYAFNINDKSQMIKCDNENCDIPFHQPGIASGYPRFKSTKAKTCPNMMARILGDNPKVQMAKFQDKCPAGTSKIALIVDGDEDYHFLRQDSNGYWSHKPGGRKVTNVDASDKKIYDPALANFNYKEKDGHLNYDNFCSYMCVPRIVPVNLQTGGNRKNKKQNGGSTKRYTVAVLYNRSNDDPMDLEPCMIDDWIVQYNGPTQQAGFEYEIIFYGSENLEDFYECLERTMKDYKKNKVIKKFKMGVVA